MTDTLKPSDVLLRARDEIMTRGHTKFSMASPEGGVCLNGALSLAIFLFPGHDLRLDYDLFREASTYIREQLIRRGFCASPHTWNDRSSTTPQDVLDILFDAAIAAKEAGE